MKKGIFDLKNKILSLPLIGLLFCVLSLTSSCTQNETKFYKANVVFNDFNMTAEYHKDINEYKEAFDLKVGYLNAQLDSLKRNFKVETNEKTKRLLYLKIADFQKSLDNELDKGQLTLQQKVEKGDQEIWTRLSKYLSEYCKERKIHLLIDISNTANTPYYDQTHDITDDCIRHINLKYNEILKE